MPEIHVGDKAPDFTLPDTTKAPVSLKSYEGRKVVIAFFPAAFTGVCEKELCTFRDSLADLNSVQADVVAISVDAPFSNKAFAERTGATFPVLSDYTRATVRAYGVELNDFAGLTGYVAAKRAVFVVNGQGAVVYRWIGPTPGVEPPYDEVRAALG